MAGYVREPDRGQRFLLLLDMMDWLPQDGIVHLIVDAVVLMDVSRLEVTCKIARAGHRRRACARSTVIVRFRQRHADRMKGLFLQVLELCREAGLIRLGMVALDGTKVKAAAGLEVNHTAAQIAQTRATRGNRRRAHIAAKLRAFSAKVGTGFAKENASKQRHRAFVRFSQIGGCSSRSKRHVSQVLN